MFHKSNRDGYSQLLPGIRIKTLVHGDKTLCAEIHLEKGNQLPLHAHVHEQTGYMISGRMRLFVAEEVFEVEPGDCWCVPGNAMHRVEVLADSVVIEVFSPVREDYLPYLT